MLANSISNCGTISKWMTRNMLKTKIVSTLACRISSILLNLSRPLFFVYFIYTAQFDRFICVSCYYNNKEVSVNILTSEIIIFHQKYMFTRHIPKLLVIYCTIWCNKCQRTILNQNVAYHTEIYQEFTCWYDLYYQQCQWFLIDVDLKSFPLFGIRRFVLRSMIA